MGITGLLPFLKKASKNVNVAQFSGGVVAIDSYCWLHRSIFCCVEQLSMGQPTDAYVHYCMKFISMLLSHKIKPILVFDGKYLPAKAETEAKRRKDREINRRKANELMQMGQHAEARNLIKRSIDITHEMALKLIKECHKMNIDCIVAPYEADAQLAYLNINRIVDVVITEDSDLILFGCKKVLFKMDLNGNGLLVDQEQLYLVMDVRSEHFNMDNFLYMCILSGCDYLSSLPGIGLNKAKKFISRNADCDIYRALTRLGSYLNMKSLVVSKEYRDSFILAVITFKHQLVFCPLKRKQVRLNPPMSDITEKQLYYAGTETDPDIALQLALGNCDPFTLKILHNFDPDNIKDQVNKHNIWTQKSKFSQQSIWSKEYEVENRMQKSSQQKNIMDWCNTVDQKAIPHTSYLKKPILVEQQDNSEYEQLNKEEILNIYESKDMIDVENNSEENTPKENKISPILFKRTNSFSKSSNTKTSPSLLFKNKSRIKGRNIMRVRKTIINEEITESKFFTKAIDETNNIRDNNDIYLSTNSNEILSEKKNVKSNEDNQTSNINLQILTTNDEIETNSHPMDIDEEHNISFVSNECKHIKNSNILSNCDLEKLHLDVPMNKNIENININKLHQSTSSEFNSEDSEFLIPQETIDNLNCSLFKWSDTKEFTQMNNKTKQNKNKRFSNSKPINTKLNTTSSTRRSQQLHSVHRQQSLLSMYGFEKKKSYSAAYEGYE